MLSIKKKGGNYQKGVPLSSDLRNQVKQLAQNYCFSEVWRKLRISRGAVSKIVKQFLSVLDKTLFCWCKQEISPLLKNCVMIWPFTVTAENCRYQQLPQILRTNFEVASTIPEKDWGNVRHSVLLPKIQCTLSCTLTI